MVILTLSFQPLAAALLVVRGTWWREPGVFIYNIYKIVLLILINRSHHAKHWGRWPEPKLTIQRSNWQVPYFEVFFVDL